MREEAGRGLTAPVQRAGTWAKAEYGELAAALGWLSHDAGLVIYQLKTAAARVDGVHDVEVRPREAPVGRLRHRPWEAADPPCAASRRARAWLRGASAACGRRMSTRERPWSWHAVLSCRQRQRLWSDECAECPHAPGRSRGQRTGAVLGAARAALACDGRTAALPTLPYPSSPSIPTLPLTRYCGGQGELVVRDGVYVSEDDAAMRLTGVYVAATGRLLAVAEPATPLLAAPLGAGEGAESRDYRRAPARAAFGTRQLSATSAATLLVSGSPSKWSPDKA